MKLPDALDGVSRLAVDTAPFIYFVERVKPYVALVRAIFKHITDGEIAGFSSVVTLSEVLVQPMHVGNTKLANRYRSILVRSDNFTLIPISPAVAEHAAEIRANFNVKLPDAFQLAAALEAGCEAFLTHDYDLLRVTTIRVLSLHDIELDPPA